MKKTISKIISLFSLGLLLFAVPDTYAADNEAKPVDAWKFMEENSADGGKAFKERFGEDSSQLIDHLGYIVCGGKACNSDTKYCVTYKKAENKRRRWRCIDKDKLAEYKKDGWEQASGDGVSPELDALRNNSETKRGQKKAIRRDLRQDENENCFKAKKLTDDQQTSSYCIEKIGTTLTVRAAEKAGGKSCEVVEVSWYQSRSCIFCPLIGVLYAAAENLTTISYHNIAKSLAIVIAVGLLVWIAIRTLIFVSELAKQDAAKYMTELLEQSFKFLMVFFILLYYDQIFDLVINPIIRSGMAFGTSFVEKMSLADRFGEAMANAIEKENTVALASFGNALPIDYKRNMENSFFDLYTYARMENLAFNVNLKYSLLQTIGKNLICIGSKLLWNVFENENDGFGLSIACIIYGLCFGAFGFVLTIAFVFYLFDAVVELGVVGALLPLLIAAWPFKLTTQYASKGFQMLLNAVFIFMMMGLITGICIDLINAAVSFNTVQTEETKDINTGLSALVIALTAIDTKALNRMVNIWSIGFLLFLVTNLISMMLLQKVKEFAGQFSSGCVPDIGNKLGGTMASAAVGTAKKAITTPAKGFASGFGDAFSGVKNRVSKKARIVRNRISSGVVEAVGLGGVMAARAERKAAEGRASSDDMDKNIQNIDEMLK